MSQDISERRVEFFPEPLDPDAVDGEVLWTVHESQPVDARVNLKDKVAWIPRARTKASEQIRFHEAAHVEFTRFHEHESEWMVGLCKMLEEYRVDYLMAVENGLPLHHRHDDYDMEFLAQRSPKELFPVALEWLQFRFHVEDPTVAPDVRKYWSLMHNRLPKLTVEKLEDAIRELVKDPTDACREREAKKLLDHFLPPPPDKKEERPPMKQEVTQEIARQERQEQEDHEEERRKAAQPKRKARVREQSPDEQQQVAEAQKDKWDRMIDEGLEHDKPGGTGCQFMIGDLEVHDHTGRNMYKAVSVKAPFTQASKGLEPEFMDRFCVDGRVFRKDHRGGVLLLDCSGSMHPDWDMITRQMAEFPNLVVMSYQGVYGARRQTIAGRLCIYSKGGRIDPVFMSEPGHSGGNMVDVESLEYASRFRGPRIWVSDGKACGGRYDSDGEGYGSPEAAIQYKIREVMRRQHWVRIRHVRDAYAYLTGGAAVEYYTTGLPRPGKPGDIRIGRRA